jgi:hypothetical protein
MNNTTIFLAKISLVASLFVGDAKAQSTPQSATGNTKTNKEYALGPCRFRIADMFGGSFRVPYPDNSPPQGGSYYLPVTGPMASLSGGFGLFCWKAND